MLTIWRRGPIVLLALVIGLVAATGISHLSGVKYQSNALIVVTGTPGTADGANSLAATYAGFIPEDEVMQQALAKAIGITDPAEYPSIGNRLVATVLNNSAIIKLSFTAPTPQEAQSGLHVLVSDLTVGVLQWKSAAAPHGDCSVNYVGAKPQTRPAGASLARAAEVQYYCPLSGAIPLSPAQGYVVLVKDASAGARSTPGALKTGALGGFLGLLLGFVVAVAWERSDRRVDDIDDVRAEVDCPAWEGALTPAIAVSILAHWRQAVGEEQIQVGIVKVGRYDHFVVAQLQRTIQQAARNQAVVFRNIDLSGQSVLEGLDTKTPIVVLCVAQGTARAKLADIVRRLRELGHTPDWAFLVPSSTIGDRLPSAKKSVAAEVKDLSNLVEPDSARNGHGAPERLSNGHVSPTPEQSRPEGPRRRIAERGPAGRRNLP
jgi:capsular polysaccharide biosynthesis protein